MLFNLRRQAFMGAALLLSLTVSVQARGSHGWFKIGGMASVADLEEESEFTQFLAFVSYELPYGQRLEDNWWFFCHWDVAAGVISDSVNESFIGSMGPRLGYTKGWFVFDIGTRLTYVDHMDLGVNDFNPRSMTNRDLDGPIHFQSHIRLGAILFDKLEIGGRLQHMSNAGMYDRNPGLDLILIDAAWRF
ncbi:MAG: acyloxyacyl hydrolase [Verrucomicrobia bacterium]|nr:acyloxyacyl hydrolase [Verrucomicrobiota bacterium]